MKNSLEKNGTSKLWRSILILLLVLLVIFPGTLFALKHSVSPSGSSIPWPSSWNDYLVNGQPVYDDEAIGGHQDPSHGPAHGVSPGSVDVASGVLASGGKNPGNYPSVQYAFDTLTTPGYIFFGKGEK